MNLKYFVASNGLQIAFKVRDCPRNFYDVYNRTSGESREFRVDDNGEMSLMFADAIPESFIVAYQELKAKERADYLEWLDRNPEVKAFVQERDKCCQ